MRFKLFLLLFSVSSALHAADSDWTLWHEVADQSKWSVRAPRGYGRVDCTNPMIIAYFERRSGDDATLLELSVAWMKEGEEADALRSALRQPRGADALAFARKFVRFGGDRAEAAVVADIGGAPALAFDHGPEEPRPACVKLSHTRIAPIKGMPDAVAVASFIATGTNLESAAALMRDQAGAAEAFFGSVDSPFLSRPKTVGDATAWFVTPSNLVTCAHCVARAGKVSFRRADGSDAPLKVVAADALLDIAVLEATEERDFSAAPLSVNPGEPALGERVWALGYPHPQFFGGAIRFSDGSVRALRVNPDMGGEAVFEMSLPVRPGASGGPVFDSSGRVCGIMRMALDESVSRSLFGHALPEVNMAVKSSAAAGFLSRQGIRPDSMPDVGRGAPERFAGSVVLITAESGG